jgi:hypothetical protein
MEAPFARQLLPVFYPEVSFLNVDEIQLPPPRDYRLYAIRELIRRHQTRDLRTVCAGREFPTDDAEFKLGGHAAEFGHVHIDFVREDAAWKLKEIWMCR